jgi:HPt (histidine-containing phosphotransfer) domain-containing protein
MDRWLRKTTPDEPAQAELQHLPSTAGARNTTAPPCVEPAELDWDLKELLERLEGDQEFLRELLSTVREDYRASLHKAHRAMAESNLPELSRAAHTIKGMLRNLSMNSAAQTAAALEKSAQDAAEKESAELLLILEGDLVKILPEVEAQLAGVKA